MLRQLKGHARPVHVARFSPDKVHVLSGGDDVTVRWWDISSGKQVARLDGHQDYVRAAAVSPASETTWVTGEAEGGGGRGGRGGGGDAFGGIRNRLVDIRIM